MAEGRSVLMQCVLGLQERSRNQQCKTLPSHSFPRGRKGASRSDESMALAPDQTNLVHHVG